MIRTATLIREILETKHSLATTIICIGSRYGCVNPFTFIYLTLTGILVGLLGGMFGFGGSSISTPLLRIIFFIPPYFALASPLPMTLLSSAVASHRYYREKLIDWEIVKKIVLVTIGGALLGSYITKYISGKSLMLLTAIFLVYIAIRFLSTKRKRKVSTPPFWMVLLAGLFIGFISGLLANGGGIFIVPVLVLLGLEIKKAIGTSIAMVFFIAIPSILMHWYLGHIYWLLTLALSVGALPGAYLGAYITVKINRERLRKAYGVFLLLFALYFAVFELMHF